MRKLFTLLFATLCVVSVLAHDFFNYSDTQTIYYNITSNTAYTVEVTYKDNRVYGGTYSGNITIPSVASWNGHRYTVTSIGEKAFYGSAGLINVNIPSSVTYIGVSAFENCDLTSITLPRALETLGHYAFKGCTRLYEMIMPNSVTDIRWGVFSGCTGLRSVTLSNSVRTIGMSAFSGCTRLTNITIPNSVKYIDYSAFSGCTGLTDITLPNSLTSINSSSFYNCTSLRNISIPDSVTLIGQQAFYGCTGLTNINIPNLVTSIKQKAFYNCTGLTSITIPNSVTEILSEAFVGCQNLKKVYNCSALEIVVGADSNGGVARYAENVHGCPTYVGDYIFVDNQLTEYMGSGITALSLPESYNGTNYTIAANAFKNNTELTSITIPNTVTSIGSAAFANCTNLTSITIPNSVTSIGADAFYYCTGLTSLTIPSSVTSIGSDAFFGCTNLKTVTNHSALRISSGSRENGYVGYYANHVYVELKVVSEDTQKGTVSGSGVVDAGTTHQIKATPAQNHIFISWNDGYTSATRNVTVFNDVTYTATFAVPSHTYYGITYQALSTTNNTAAVVSATATGAVSIYTQVTLNDNKAYNVVSIQPNVFAGQNVTSITLPSTLTSIGANAFLNCTNLKTVNNRSSLPITAGSADYGYVGYYADHVYIKLEVTSENIAKGIVTGNGNFDAGSTQLIQALPAMGYKFSRWSDGDLNATRFITAINDAQFTAYFAVDPISACAQVEETTVRVIGKEIVSEQPFHVYTLTGINVTAQNGYLPTGLYVVQTLDQCVKIFIP